jgi:uncharacterized protein (DUF1684 family)
MSSPATLWQWRRAIADLYVDIRRAADPEAAHALWRARRAELFSTHDQSPIDRDARARNAGPFVFPYDPALRFTVSLEAIEQSRETMSAGADGVVTLIPFARTSGLAPALGAELVLYWIEQYGGGVFLPFRDATNGTETYGGGRYLLDTVKSADLGEDESGRVILDFNFSYFPSCAYSDRYVCPLAPAANRFSTAIRAGERNHDDLPTMAEA